VEKLRGSSGEGFRLRLLSWPRFVYFGSPKPNLFSFLTKRVGMFRWYWNDTALLALHRITNTNRKIECAHWLPWLLETSPKIQTKMKIFKAVFFFLLVLTAEEKNYYT